MSLAGILLLGATPLALPAAPAPADVPAPAHRAPEPLRLPGHAIEISLLLGPNFVTGQPLVGAFSDRRVGMGGALQVRYRSPYFLGPFVEAGYAFLSSGAAQVQAGDPDAGRVVDDRLDAWHVAAGASIDLWRLRLGLAASLYVFGLTSRLAGVTSSTQGVSLGPSISASVTLVRRPRFHLAADLVAHSAPQDDIHYFTVGLSVHGEPIVF